MKILFATDVLVDVWANADSFSDSYAALDTALSRNFDACVSVCTLASLGSDYRVGDVVQNENLYRALNNTLEVFSVIDAHAADCSEALDGTKDSFTSSLIAYSAVRNGIDFIVSWDKGAYAVTSVPVLSPHEFVGMYKLKSITYAMVELPVEEVRRIVSPIADKYGAKRVSLFGSRARGDALDSSDFDILVDKGSMRGLRVLDFQEELRQALKRDVDVTTTQGASKRFLDKVYHEEVVLYEAR